MLIWLWIGCYRVVQSAAAETLCLRGREKIDIEQLISGAWAEPAVPSSSLYLTHPQNGGKFHYSPLQQLPHRAPILRAAWRPQTRGHNAPPPFHFDQSCRATWARTSGATADAGARAELEDAGWQRISEPTAELGGGGGSRGRRQISGPAAELGASGDSWRPAVNLSGRRRISTGWRWISTSTGDTGTFDGAGDAGTAGTSSRSSTPKLHGLPLFGDREWLGTALASL
jgi:hypothetical protein